MSVLDVGDRLAGFEIEAYVARGGMAVVYRARDLQLGRTVALKVMAPELASDPTFRRRFTMESRLAASIDHPNIIPIYAAGEAEGQLYLVMRYVDGQTLSKVFRGQGPLTPADTLTLFRQVASALDAAHARDLVHRDVKPGNVLLDQGNELARRHVYLTDFGLTKRVSKDDASTTTTGQFLGTLRYVAPEQITRAPVNPSADVYSLACVIVEALTGQPPFVRDDEAALLWAHVAAPPPAVSERNADLPTEVDAVLRRALAKEPPRRQRSCGALIEELTAALTPTMPVIAPLSPTSAKSPTSATSARSPRSPTPLTTGNRDALDPPTVSVARLKAPVATSPGTPAPAAAYRPASPPTPSVRSTSAVNAPARPARPAQAARRKRRWLPLAIVAFTVLVAGAGVTLLAFPGRWPAAQSPTTTSTPSPSSSTPDLPRSTGPLPADTLVWRREDGGRWTIETLTLDGEDRVLLRGRQNRSVQLTPDRRTILYLREANDRVSLRAMSADGEQDRILFTDGTAVCPRMSRPSVRADGVLALFCADAEGSQGRLNLMATDGTLLGVLDRGRIGDPTFSPDGRSVFYWRADSAGTAGALLEVAADGSSEPQRLLPRDGNDYADPVVAPNGDQLLATRLRDETSEIVAVDLTDRPADGAKRLTRNYLDSGPSWSPDGSQILFRRGTDEESQLLVADADGTGAQTLIRNDGYASQPVWAAQ